MGFPLVYLTIFTTWTVTTIDSVTSSQKVQTYSYGQSGNVLDEVLFIILFFCDNSIKVNASCHIFKMHALMQSTHQPFKSSLLALHVRWWKHYNWSLCRDFWIHYFVSSIWQFEQTFLLYHGQPKCSCKWPGDDNYSSLWASCLFQGLILPSRWNNSIDVLLIQYRTGWLRLRMPYITDTGSLQHELKDTIWSITSLETYF